MSLSSVSLVEACRQFKPTHLDRISITDYGFNPEIYVILDSPIPQEKDWDALFERYCQLVETSGPDAAERLHALYTDQQLRSALGKNFEWVRTSRDLF